MRIRFLSNTTPSTPDNRSERGDVRQDFHFTTGREYVVLGLNFSTGNDIHGAGVWFHLLNDYEQLSWAPSVLFEIIDDRASSSWRLRLNGEEATLWPLVFYEDFFHDELAAGDPKRKQQLEKLVEDLLRK